MHEGDPGHGAGADGEDDEGEEGEELEIRGECEPGEDACDPGFGCEETCTPSFCDDEGRCTQDCMIGYACIGNDPVE